MRHFFSARVRVVLILALLLAVGLVIGSNLTGLSIPNLVVKGGLTPLRAGANALTQQAERMYDYMFRYEALEAENAALRAEIAQMREEELVAEAISRENDRLRELLELTDATDHYALVDGYVIGRSSNEWTSAVTVNRGTAHGVQVGMCAITENEEVVGLVVEAGANYCVIRTVLDSSLEVSATIASSGYGGMVQGGYAQGQAGLLRMDYLPSAAVIRNREQVVTAGSTLYPRNLILGYVIDAGFGETGVEKYAILEPAADIDDLEQVFILKDYQQG
jgi:rod shape-determining protein MreC